MKLDNLKLIEYIKGHIHDGKNRLENAKTDDSEMKLAKDYMLLEVELLESKLENFIKLHNIG